ncbi:MAG TPA: glycine cleavage T C-terminal barrel domain-containing protein [Planctomycetota bacterium]|nr:glycine cleavage T C-terminal barrel domain-containing protein [Planctomycetota bacterium]
MEQSILTEVHRAAGAVLSRDEPPRLLTYGDVPAEYIAAQEGCALFDRTDRGLLRVSGPEATAFLHRLLANAVLGLGPGRGNRNLLLSPKGKVRFDFDLSVDPEGILLSTPPGQAAELARALDTYLFAEKVQIAERTAEHAPLEVCGPRTDEVVRAVVQLERLPGEVDAGEHRGERETLASRFAGRSGHFEDAQVMVTALPVAGSSGLRLDGGPAVAEPLWEALRAAGARPCGHVARESLRVEAGAAEPGVDVDEQVYPQEARLERAFSLEKGCYIGQEVVAKIDTYGGLNKRLVALRVAGDDPVARGARLWREEAGELRDLGLVTSWAYSFALEGGLVLAYVKRRHQAPGTTFRLGDAAAGPPATIVPLPVRANAVAPTGELE